MAQRDVAAYARQSRWTEPGKFTALVAALPADPTVLPEIVGGLVLHPLFAGAAAKENPEPELRRMSDILAAIVSKDARPLDQTRQPDKRVFGTCRNYALVACAILRQHRRPARLRVGFADYFTSDFAEDHWVCEYYDGAAWPSIELLHRPPALRDTFCCVGCTSRALPDCWRRMAKTEARRE